MKRKLAFALTAGLLALTAEAAVAAEKKAGDHAAIVQALKDNEAQWNRDFAAKDLEKLLAHYAEDSSLMGPGMPTATGKAAIRPMLKEMLNDPNLSLKFTATRVEVSQSGDLAFTQGDYTMTMTDPVAKKLVSDKGAYVTVYRKQADGSWKAVSDIATSTNPPSK